MKRGAEEREGEEGGSTSQAAKARRSHPHGKETGLTGYVNSTVSIITNDGRHILGLLKGFDQATNLILEGSKERIYSPEEGVEEMELGLYLLRGDCIAVVGEVDDDLDSQIDLPSLKGHPLSEVVH
ncbi:small nuclear ribonucleoprotein LSm8 [Chloropicon primus]|uniref:U6 snRNA-associated Sm-like protein LSm8 n=2 Tax=Chloropicon primus TaxID=1764295 RepID=A0A5B8MUU8_9CHLO|nr:small nuclear ribonucleoprotein [Chloropicon primus]UPR03537.1 small nuclear ribonucleoprotein LSm8 [Chloropicon primus]|eukprot:QDZ24329.1 small nuclear ribonucleoprotein [Chloropicon primus]